VVRDVSPTLAVAVSAYLLATVLVSLVGLRVLLALPPTHFRDGPRPATAEALPLRAWLWRIGRNALGLALIAVGLVLSLPFVPGQGVLTILVGVLLVDFPGRRRLELRLARRPGVLATLNRIRARFGRPPLAAPEPQAPYL